MADFVLFFYRGTSTVEINEIRIEMNFSFNNQKQWPLDRVFPEAEFSGGGASFFQLSRKGDRGGGLGQKHDWILSNKEFCGDYNAFYRI